MQSLLEDDNSILESIHACVLSSKTGVEKLNKAITQITDKPEPRASRH